MCNFTQIFKLCSAEHLLLKQEIYRAKLAE